MVDWGSGNGQYSVPFTDHAGTLFTASIDTVSGTATIVGSRFFRQYAVAPDMRDIFNTMFTEAGPGGRIKCGPATPICIQIVVLLTGALITGGAMWADSYMSCESDIRNARNRWAAEGISCTNQQGFRDANGRWCWYNWEEHTQASNPIIGDCVESVGMCVLRCS